VIQPLFAVVFCAKPSPQQAADVRALEQVLLSQEMRFMRHLRMYIHMSSDVILHTSSPIVGITGEGFSEK